MAGRRLAAPSSHKNPSQDAEPRDKLNAESNHLLVKALPYLPYKAGSRGLRCGGFAGANEMDATASFQNDQVKIGHTCKHL